MEETNMMKNNNLSMDELIAYVNGQSGEFIIHIEFQTTVLNDAALKQYQRVNIH